MTKIKNYILKFPAGSICFLLLAFLFFSAVETNAYQITVNVSGSGRGIVHFISDTAYYYYPTDGDVFSSIDIANNATASVSVDPTTGFYVTWDDCESSGGVFSFYSWGEMCTFVSLDMDKSLSINFLPNIYEVTAHATGDGNGTIVSEPLGINFHYPDVSIDTIEGGLPHESYLTITANADIGSVVSWNDCVGPGPILSKGDGTSTATCYTSEAFGSDLIVTATFTLMERVLSISKTGNCEGVVTSSQPGMSCENNICLASYDHGSEVTINAISQNECKFTGWSYIEGTRDECINNNMTPCTILMDSNKVLGANFYKESANFNKKPNPWPIFFPAIIKGSSQEEVH